MCALSSGITTMVLNKYADSNSGPSYPESFAAWQWGYFTVSSAYAGVPIGNLSPNGSSSGEIVITLLTV